MKKLFYSFATLAIFAGCTKVAEVENTTAPKEDGNLVHMTIRADAPETKTYISQVGETNKYQPGWNKGDKLAVFFDGVKDTKDAELDNSGDNGKAAEFKGDVTVGTGSHKVYAFYPATTVFKKGDANTKVQLQVATVQRPTANNFDPAADIAIGKAMDIDITSDKVTIDNMVFARPLATVKVSITESNDDIAASEKINAITIEGEADLTGVFEWDYDAEETTTLSDDPSVTADLSANPIAFGTPVYLLVNPATLAAGTELTVTVSTDSHEITKTISLPNDIKFPIGSIAELRINLDNTTNVVVSDPVAEPTSTGWFLVKKAHWLRPGDEVAIVAAEHNVAMSTTQESKYRGNVDVSISEEKLTVIDDVQRFTLETGTAANTFAFKAVNGSQAGKYIYAPGNDNLLKSQSEKDDNASFYVSVASDGEASMQSMCEGERDMLRYNSSSPRFCCYANSSSIKENVRIYKHYSSGIPSLSTPSNLEAVAIDDDVIVAWDKVDDADSYTITLGETVVTDVPQANSPSYKFENVADGEYTVTVKAVSNDHSTLLDSELAITSVTVAASVPDLSGYYLIGSYNDSKWILMSSTNGGNFYSSYTSSVSKEAASVSFSDFADVTDINTYVWKVEAYDGAYSIKSMDTSKYVSYTGSSNAAQAVEALAASTKFDITLTETEATIESCNVSGRGLKYNSASPRFAFYTSGQKSIFMIPATYDERTEVTLSFAEPELNYNTDNYGTCVGQTATASPEVAAITSNITYSISGDAIGTVNASTGAVTLNGTTGTATITATFAGDANYMAAKESYVISVSVPGAESIVYTLLPAITGENAPHNAYASEATTTIDGIGWAVTGNSSLVPWRIGGKSITKTDRTIYSTTAISNNISKIEITHGAASSITVNSMTVIVSKNADFSSPVSTLTPSFTANGTVTVNRPDGSNWSNCYYKFVYNVTVTNSSNKYIEFSKAEFTGK